MKIRKLLKTVSVFVLTCLLTFSGFLADAHPGRTDSNGGHWNRKTGEYHYHNSGYTKSTRSKQTSTKSTAKKTTSTVKKSSSASAKPSNPQTASANANEKLKANNFFLADEVARVYEEERTPDLQSVITDEQRKAIIAEYNAAKSANTKRSQSFGATITDKLEKSYYQAGVLRNMMLKTCREIAKKYGIKAGDVHSIVGE